MIPIHPNRLIHTTSLYQSQIDDHLETVRKQLTKWIKAESYNVKDKRYVLSQQQIFYLRYMRSKLNDIVLTSYDNHLKYVSIFTKILSTDSMEFMPFKDKLLHVLDYEFLRSGNKKIPGLYPDFFNTLGIKTCVYCNAQLTISVEKLDQSISALFQLDHSIDKASYPCFAISFFNLYPVCASCNNNKGRKKISFRLYSNDSNKLMTSEYQFILDKASIAEFRLTRNCSQIKFAFDDKGHGLNEHLAVQGIYNTQKDLAAEIIVKAEIYNQSYKEGLQKSFSRLYGKNGIANIDFNRFIIGNYVDARDIHKRPMAKFTQDIARQLKLIP